LLGLCSRILIGLALCLILVSALYASGDFEEGCRCKLRDLSAFPGGDKLDFDALLSYDLCNDL